MKVRIIQLLCPQRHCVAAVAYQSIDGNPSLMHLRAMMISIEMMVEAGQMSATCGLCGASDLKPEDAPTRYETLDEARPELLKMQADNAATAAMWRSRN
jgi:hypothetical protein